MSSLLFFALLLSFSSSFWPQAHRSPDLCCALTKHTPTPRALYTTHTHTHTLCLCLSLWTLLELHMMPTKPQKKETVLLPPFFLAIFVTFRAKISSLFWSFVALLFFFRNYFIRDEIWLTCAHFVFFTFFFAPFSFFRGTFSVSGAHTTVFFVFFNNKLWRIHHVSLRVVHECPGLPR